MEQILKAAHNQITSVMADADESGSIIAMMIHDRHQSDQTIQNVMNCLRNIRASAEEAMQQVLYIHHDTFFRDHTNIIDSSGATYTYHGLREDGLHFSPLHNQSSFRLCIGNTFEDGKFTAKRDDTPYDTFRTEDGTRLPML